MTYAWAAALLREELAHGPMICLTEREYMERAEMLKIAISLVEREAQKFEDAIDGDFQEVLHDES